MRGIMNKLIKKYSHAWVLLYAFLYMPWFLWLERTVKTDFSVIHIELDDKIPFMEIFVIPYFLWFAYIFVTVAYFFFRDRSEFYRCTAYLFGGMTVCLLIYTIYPKQQNIWSSKEVNLTGEPSRQRKRHIKNRWMGGCVLTRSE